MTKIRGKDLPLAERSPWRNRMLAAEEMLRETREDLRAHLMQTDSMSGKALASRIARIDTVIREAPPWQDANAAKRQWQPIETAPKVMIVLVFGIWAGEINGPSDMPAPYVAIYSGSSDYTGFDWQVVGTDAYAAWVKATHWMPLPEAPK